jgi:hypothetical protein
MNLEQASPATQTVQDVPAACESPSSSQELVAALRQFAHERSEVVALACLGIGFVLGWKLKIW